MCLPLRKYKRKSVTRVCHASQKRKTIEVPNQRDDTTQMGMACMRVTQSHVMRKEMTAMQKNGRRTKANTHQEHRDIEDEGDGGA